MPTVDELLGPAPEGKPSVDDLLGPAPEPMMIPQIGGTFELHEAQPTPGEDNATRGFLNMTSVGRVLDAFGEGAKHGWGGRPLGLPDETNKALRDAGLFPNVGDTWTLPLKAFNEGLIQPAAVGLDAIMRGIGALQYGTAGAVGQTATEAGSTEGKRLTRDIMQLADTLGIVSGVAPAAGVRVKGRAAAATEEVKPAAKVEPPVKPHDPLPPSEHAIDKAGNINLDRVTAGEDVKDIIREAALREGVFSEAKPLAAPEAPAPAAPNLFGKDLSEVDQIAKTTREQEKAILVEVFGDEKTADKYRRLEKMRHTASSPADADRYEMQFREMVDNLPAEKAAKLDQIGDADEIGHVRQAMQETEFTPDTPTQQVAGEVAFALRELNAGDLEAVMAGKAALHQQEHAIRFARSFGEMRARGVSEEEIRGMVAGELRKSGFGGSAEEFFDTQISLLKRAKQNASSTLAAPDAPPSTPVAPSKAPDINFEEARRGAITFEQTQEMADALGMTTKQLTERKIGEAFNAEELLAARNMLVQSATEVRQAATAARGGADVDVLKFQELATRHMAIQEQVAGLTAEAGRALSQFRIMAQATGEAQDIAKVIENLGGRGKITDMARMIDDLDTPQQISKFLNDSKKATLSDKIKEVWINALLSGPQTHVTNMVSNSLVAMWRVPETALASGIGKVRTAFGGDAERVAMGEAGARLFGVVQGAKDGITAGWRTFKTEIPSDMATKLEQPRPRAIGGKVGEVARLPGRALMAEDEFFKAIGFRQEINALAYRTATREGLSGDAFKQRVAELVNNPTDKMVKKAKENADYQTFTTELGKFGKAVQTMSNEYLAAKVVIPFVRTPTNIVKFAAERTPLGFFSKEAWADMKGANGAAARDTRLARIGMGTAVGVTTASLAAEGYITGGGPVKPNERAVLQMTGWQPYSVKIGDMYYSYGRLEPLGMIMGLSADSVDIVKHGWRQLTGQDEADLDKLGTSVVASASKNILSKTWARGISDLVKAISDPDRYGEQWIQRMAGTVVPTGVAQIARDQDPYLKDAQSVSDAVKARVPGLSAEVLAKRDVWGEKIKLEGSLGPDAISPIYTRMVNEDPVTKELIVLKIFPAPVEKKIKGVELTPQQYDDYQRIAGRLAKVNLDAIVATPDWASLPAFARQEVISRTITRARGTATNLLMMQNPDIIQKATDKRIKEISGAK